MRVALISDLHGNALALEAVLDALAQEGADQTVCLGDVATLGPEPRGVLQRIRSLRCACVLGNHDHFLLEPEKILAYTQVESIVQSVEWCRAQLSSEDLDYLRSLPTTIEIDLGGGIKLTACHGSPRSLTEDLLATTPAQELEEAIGSVQTAVVAAGHTHLPMVRQHRGTLLVNPGSLGMPFLEYAYGRTPKVLCHAEYATVQAEGGRVSVALHRLPLAPEALRDTLRNTDLPLKGMLMHQYCGDEVAPGA